MQEDLQEHMMVDESIPSVQREEAEMHHELEVSIAA
jgi:hypothetical protein